MSEFWWGVLTGAGVVGLPLLVTIVVFLVKLADGMGNL